MGPLLLTTALVGDEWSASRLGRFNPRERAPGTHWEAVWAPEPVWMLWSRVKSCHKLHLIIESHMSAILTELPWFTLYN
jgi:hypothetical protein